MGKKDQHIITDAEVMKAAAGRFMIKSCINSKFTLINGRQLDEFQKNNIILQIDTEKTYMTEITKDWRPWKQKHYKVYMVEYVPMKKGEDDAVEVDSPTEE